MITLTLPVPPVLNSLYAPNKWGGIRVTRAGRLYKKDAGWEAIQQIGRPKLEGKLVVDLVIYRKRNAGDVDAYLKVLFDTLNDIVWLDDKQVVAMHVEKRVDTKNPRVELTIRDWEE